MPKIAYLAQHRRGLPELLKQLTETGFEVYRLDPNRTAYRSLRDDPPDLIVADMTLRASHVKKVLQAITNSSQTRHIPISIVGLEEEEAPQAEALVPHANGYYTGPVTRRLLVDIVRTVMVQETSKP